MDFSQVIISLLGLQGVSIEDFKEFRKQRRVEIRVRQNRGDCFCPHCGLQFSRVKDWDLKVLRGTPLGIYQNVTIKFMQLGGLWLHQPHFILQKNPPTLWVPQSYFYKYRQFLL